MDVEREEARPRAVLRTRRVVARCEHEPAAGKRSHQRGHVSLLAEALAQQLRGGGRRRGFRSGREQRPRAMAEGNGRGQRGATIRTTGVASETS